MRPATCPTRHALQRVIDEGQRGTFARLAALAGVSADQARATLKELRRAGGCAQLALERTGRAGAARAVYGRPAANAAAFDALAHVRAVWR